MMNLAIVPIVDAIKWPFDIKSGTDKTKGIVLLF